MAIAAAIKHEVITQNRRHDGDTGSPEVQVAILTERIRDITAHLASHKHDYASQRGLKMMVGRRTRLLRYLSKKDHGAYEALIKKLGLRK